MKENNEIQLKSMNIPFPICIINYNGEILDANNHIKDVFAYEGIKGSKFFQLTGIDMEKVFFAIDNENDKNLYIERNENTFSLTFEKNGNDRIIVYFQNITKYIQMKDKYEDEKLCICKMNIDNYEELLSSLDPQNGAVIAAQVENLIRSWAIKMNASIERVRKTLYVIHFENKYIKNIQSSRFEILDEIRSIETDLDFPLSLSIGVGIGGDNFSMTEEYASAALELALGRGGDQAVIKKRNSIMYYGGKTQTVEKRNKGKSRIIAHALKKLIEQSDKVFIMGHRNADMDAFGASLGIYRMCLNRETKGYIVLDVVNDSLKTIYNQVEESGDYNIISTKKALEIIEEDDLIVVVDTHKPSLIEEPKLLEETDRIVVIDHHRKGEESITNTILAYIETYASSTAELVSELLQYSGNNKSILKLEAEGLLAGMTVDTNRFAVKTGVRTFEAAAWLRKCGADTTEVKRFFQTDMESFKVRAKGVASASFHDNGIVTSICEGEHLDAQVINAKVADELLNIKGVKASFIAGKNAEGITCLSGRSLGDLNVQLVMEKLGGGGHLTTAGAQVKEEPEEAIEKIIEITNELFFDN